MTQAPNKRIPPGALSRRAAMAQTAIISVVVLLFSLAVIILSTYRLNSQLDSRIASIAILAETSLATSVWQVDHDSARDFINAVIHDPTVVFAQVVTGRETMASRSKSQYAGHTFDYFQDNRGFQTRVVEIRKYGDWIGTFRLAVSLESIHQDMLINIVGTLVLAIAMILVISQTTLSFSRKRVFEPLKKLEEAATNIAEGNLDTPIDTHLPGELGSLARSVDDMRDSVRHLIGDLQVSKDRLEDHRNALEKTIQERTDELEQKNKSLNKAIEDVQNAKRNAEVANMAKSSFLASMSHEIRTPMNAILGMADILQESELTHDQARYVLVFKTAGENLLEILDDILDLSKIEAGHLALEQTPFNLTETIDRACTSVEPKAMSKELNFTCKIGSEVPNRFIGDPNRIRQVLLNIMGNAVKFTESGHVSLSVEASHDGGVDPMLQFEISDSGPGIHPEKLDTIFDSFTQADDSTTRRFGGTGLGLAISRELVRMMGGRIWVESAHNSGSTFHFTIRLRTDASKEIPQPETLVDHSHDDQPPAANLLMIEDSRYNAFVIQTYLKNTACELTVKENGEEGLKAFRQGNYDGILMDIQMPVMDGYQATRAIREWEAETGMDRTPVIAMTAYVQPEDVKLCEEAGTDNHLAKPVKKSALFAMLRSTINPPNQDTPPEPPLTVDNNAEFAEIRQSMTAARAALSRQDFQSLKVLGNDIAARGTTLSNDTLRKMGATLEQAAMEKTSTETLQAILKDLAEHLER